MNRIACTAILASLLTGSLAFAQQSSAPDATPTPTQKVMHHRAPDPARETAHLAKRLKLTPDQSAKLQPILADRDQKISDARANTSLSSKEVHHQIRAIHEGTMQQLSTVLTPDQMQQMKAMHHHHGGKDQQNQQTAPAPGL